MTYEIVSTGSGGNAVIINGGILIDCGVPWKRLKPYARGLRLVLLTHIHSDHFNPAAVRALGAERPTLRWGCCEWMVRPLLDAGVDKHRIDPYEPGKIYRYDGVIKALSPFSLTHDVPNCGYTVQVSGERLFYATDTGALDGIRARNYDLYMIEANHGREELQARAAEKMSVGAYAYEVKAAQNHLSVEQTENWLLENAGQHSEFVFLHQHHDKDGEESAGQGKEGICETVAELRSLF